MNSARHIKFLDQIRGIAILSVILFHILGAVYGYDLISWRGNFRNFSTIPISYLCLLPLNFGDMGVAIFFVVSGFCIHWSFQQQGEKWAPFFIRRIFRIVPAYFAALVFFFLLWMQHYQVGVGDSTFWKQLLSHLFFIFNFHPFTLTAINGAFWTLAIEVQLYLIYPLLLFLAGKFGWRRALFIPAVIEILIRGFDGHLMQTVSMPENSREYILWLLANSPFAFWLSWSIGAFVAEIYLKNGPMPFTNISPAWWFGLGIAAYFFKPLEHFRFLFFALATALFISRRLANVGYKVKVPAFSLAALGKIGLWSYSIYLLHEPLLTIYFYGIDWIVPEQYRSPLVAVLVVSAMCVAIIPFSFLWYKIFEIPGIAIGKRIIESKKVRPIIDVEKEIFALLAAVLISMAVGTWLLNSNLHSVTH